MSFAFKIILTIVGGIVSSHYISSAFESWGFYSVPPITGFIIAVVIIGSLSQMG